MKLSLFGYELSKEKKETEDNLDTFAPPKENDGAIELSGYDVGTDYISNTKYIYDFESHFENEEQRINEYRRVSLMVEADYAITDIVNEAVVQNQFDDTISLNLDDTEWSDSIRNKVSDEWKEVVKLFDLNNNISSMFHRWYVDGKIYYHKIVDSTKQKEGIKEIRYLDPRRIKKIREIDKIDTAAGDRISDVREYYIYSLRPIKKSGVGISPMTSDYQYGYGTGTQVAMEINPDMIAYSHSGLIVDDDIVLSYLQKAMKPLNQMNLVEDAIVIYRLSRAPERRIFYVDVGNLNKTRAEQYIKSLINKYRNKFVYNTGTGTIKTNKQNLSMMGDIWLPRKDGSRGTEVSTLEGGQNLGELEDLNYFKNKVYRALNIPISRLEAESTFNMGRSSEITRDEVKFSKFAEKLRNNFSDIFYDILRTQLLLKRIITEDDWKKEKTNIRLIYSKDSYYEELKEQEILQTRVEILRDIDEHVGKYFSVEWIRKRVHMQDDEEIKEIDDQNREWEKEHREEIEDAGFDAGGFGGGSFDGGGFGGGGEPPEEDEEEATGDPKPNPSPNPSPNTSDKKEDNFKKKEDK